MKKIADPGVASVFKAYPAAVRRRLMALRALVFETAARTEGVGRLTETLKWCQPSYLTAEIGGLVGQFKAIYPDTFRYEGQRAIVFAPDDRLPKRALAHCLGLALTHHRRRK